MNEKKINIGEHYSTNYCFEEIEVVVNRIIPNSHFCVLNTWDTACQVTILDTQHTLLRRKSELRELK